MSDYELLSIVMMIFAVIIPLLVAYIQNTKR